MPFNDCNCLDDPEGLKELKQSHVGRQLANVPKGPKREHEVFERNARENVIDQDSVYVVVLNLVKICNDVRTSPLINHKGKPGTEEDISTKA